MYSRFLIKVIAASCSIDHCNRDNSKQRLHDMHTGSNHDQWYDRMQLAIGRECVSDDTMFSHLAELK